VPDGRAGRRHVGREHLEDEEALFLRTLAQQLESRPQEAPARVALVAHLIRRSGEGFRPFGLSPDSLRREIPIGILAGLGVAAVGLGIYLGSVAIGVNRFVVPVPPLGH